MSGHGEIFPNLFLVGAMKAGTTSVHYVLSEHPQIFMSEVKEPKYFAFYKEQRHFLGPQDPANQRLYVDRRRYLSLFRNRGTEKYAGESSTIYLYSPEAAENIKHEVPDARILVILRNPVDRAYSNFLYARQRGLEPEPSFQRALEVEEARIAQGWGALWHYKSKGLYAEQLERYLMNFPQRQIFIGLYDDLQSTPTEFYRQIWKFLEVSDSTVPTDTVLNRSGAVRSPFLHVLLLFFLRLPQRLPRNFIWRLRASAVGGVLSSRLEALYNLNLTSPPPLPLDVKNWLSHYYLSDIQKTEQIVGKSLDLWQMKDMKT